MNGTQHVQYVHVNPDQVPCVLRLNIMYMFLILFIYVAYVPIFILLFVIRYVPFF